MVTAPSQLDAVCVCVCVNGQDNDDHVLLGSEEAQQLLGTESAGVRPTATANVMCTYFEKIKINTRQYAKRQLTWFRKDKSIRWMDARDEAGIMEMAKAFAGAKT